MKSRNGQVRCILHSCAACTEQVRITPLEVFRFRLGCWLIIFLIMHILGFSCFRLRKTFKIPYLFKILIEALQTTSIYPEVSSLKYLWNKSLHLRQVMSYNLVQFPYKTCSIAVCFNVTCLQLLISLAGNMSTNSCKVGRLWSIIVRN